MIFVGCKPTFGVVNNGSPRLLHDFLYSTLLYTLHFSLSVIIRFKNALLSLRFSSESLMEIHWDSPNPLNFFCLNRAVFLLDLCVNLYFILVFKLNI